MSRNYPKRGSVLRNVTESGETFRMGNIFSGNYKRQRRPLVEECFRIAAMADECPRCGRGVEYLYSLPKPPLVFACRHCLNLGFASTYRRQLVNQTRRREALPARFDALLKRSQRAREREANREPDARRPIMELETAQTAP